MKVVFLILLINLSGLGKAAHPVHVSVCNIEIENQKATIAVKLFSDDFQLALEHNYSRLIPLEELTHDKHKNIVDNYFNQMLKIRLNKSENIRLIYSRTEMKEDAVWYYFNTELKRDKELIITNQLLFDIYLDQTNLLIVNINGKQNGYRFTPRNPEQTIKLK